MNDKFSYQQWRKVSLDLNKTKQNVQQMSKLYIISHEKVKAIIRKYQTNLQYNPTTDCQKQLDFIRKILQRLAERQNDQYLSKIDPNVLDKYEKNFFDLVQLLKLALMTHNSRQKLNIQALKGVAQDKWNKNDEFSLRKQLEKSQKRMVRTKSGHRITKDKPAADAKMVNNTEYEQLFNQNQIQLFQPQEHQRQFLSKRQKLQETINNHINKQGYSLNFKKKYDKLDDYLQQRKEFADLIFSQKYYDDMIEQGRTRKNEPKIHEKKDPDLNKLFPQFNIKTKYMKKQVKQNILKVIFDVKKQLLKQIHESNVTKMRQANDGGMIKLNQNRKLDNHARAVSSDACSSKSMENRFRSTNRRMENKRLSLTNLKGSGLRKTACLWRQDENYKKMQEKANQMFSISKMPQYQVHSFN